MCLCHWLCASQIRCHLSWEKHKSFPTELEGERWCRCVIFPCFVVIHHQSSTISSSKCCCHTQGVSVEIPRDQTKWKSIQCEQDLCSDNLWTPSRAPVTTSSWAVIPSWHAAEQGFSTARSLPRKPQHICSVLEPLSILCIARLDKLSLLIFKTFHSRGLAWNGEPLVSSICRGPSAHRASPGKAAAFIPWPRGDHVLSAAAKHTRLFTPPQWAAHLCCAFFMFLEQCFYLFFPATSQVLEMLLRTSSRSLWNTDFAYPFERKLASCSVTLHVRLGWLGKEEEVCMQSLSLAWRC